MSNRGKEKNKKYHLNKIEVSWSLFTHVRLESAEAVAASAGSPMADATFPLCAHRGINV